MQSIFNALHYGVVPNEYICFRLW